MAARALVSLGYGGVGGRLGLSGIGGSGGFGFEGCDAVVGGGLGFCEWKGFRRLRWFCLNFGVKVSLTVLWED